MQTVIYEELKVLDSPYVSSKIGSFAIAKKDEHLKFDHCREVFADKFNKSDDGIYYLHDHNQRTNIVEFLLKTESILKLNSKSRFAETNRNDITWIKPSDFWKECKLRSSLFTILLRVSLDYDYHLDNYEEALFSDKYTKETRRAIMRFLFGFTRYCGPDFHYTNPSSSLLVMGWYSLLSGKSDREIKEHLQYPGKSKLSIFSIGEETAPIWI